MTGLGQLEFFREAFLINPLQRQFQNGDYGSEQSSLSRPYRTYPQKPADWSLHHHKIDMDKMTESQPSQANTKTDYSGSIGHGTPPTTVTGGIPNGGPMIKVSGYEGNEKKNPML